MPKRSQGQGQGQKGQKGQNLLTGDLGGGGGGGGLI